MKANTLVGYTLTTTSGKYVREVDLDTMEVKLTSFVDMAMHFEDYGTAATVANNIGGVLVDDIHSKNNLPTNSY